MVTPHRTAARGLAATPSGRSSWRAAAGTLRAGLGEARAILSERRPAVRTAKRLLGVLGTVALPPRQRWLLRTTLVDRNRSYTRFVILTRARTGSTYLASLLDSHPSVRCFGELFNKQWPYPEDEGEKLRYLRNEVYGPQPGWVRASGFKLLYEQAHTATLEASWRRLVRDRSVRVIHLTRENLLRAELSLTLAETTGSWSALRASGASELPRARLDPARCVEAFVRTRRQIAEHEARFVGHPMLRVTYEQLVEDSTGTERRIQSFLGLPPAELASPFVRQGTRTLRDSIANYDEVAAALAGTEWASFLRESP